MRFTLMAAGVVLLIASAAACSPASSRQATPSPAQPQPTSTSTPQPNANPTDTYAQLLASCHGDPNGATITLFSTSRRFVNLPRALYPDGGSFVPVSGTASGGYISNGGPPGHSMQSSAMCWSTYYELDGDGQVDFVAKSPLAGAPDYTIHFVVHAH